MAQRSREESLRIIQDFVNSSKGAANTAVPASAQPAQQRISREESLRIIQDFVSSGNNQDSAASGGRSGSFAGKKAAAGFSGKFGQADSVQAKTDTRSSERAALEAQLNELNDLGFNATAKQQAEAQAKRAQIEKRLKEIDESSKPNKDTSGLNAAQAERFNELQEELASIKLPSFVPAGGPARELANRREEILAELDELDKAAGRDARSYDGLSRRTNWLKSWLNRTGASYTNAVGNMAELINREDKPIQGRDYEAENEKFADFIGRFDPKSADALRQNVPQANKNISDSFKKASDNAYKAADTMLERSEGQLAKAKYGVSGAKSIAMDAGSTLLDIGVDRLGAAALGVPGLANMFARVYGIVAQDARLRGDDVETASLKGLKAATIEVVTERIGGAFEGAYGKSLTSAALDAVRKKFGNVMNRLERSGVLRWVLDTVGEGGEEALADILNTTVDHMVGWDDGSMTTIEDILSQKDDILYDTFLGSLVGSLGASTNLISNRANARANAQNSAPAQTAQETQNVQRDIPAAPKTENARTADSGALNSDVQASADVQNAEDIKNTAPNGAESTVVNTDPARHTAAEQSVIDEYQAAVDDNLVNYIETVRDNAGAKIGRYSLKRVNDRAAQDIKRLTGVDTTGNKTVIEPRIVEHILKRHGENGSADSSMRDINDIARIQYVLDNYDDISYGGKSGAYRTAKPNGRAGQADTVIFSKAVNGTYYVVEATPDTKAKTVFVTSAYMSKKNAASRAVKGAGDSRVANAEASRSTSETSGANSPAINAEDVQTADANAWRGTSETKNALSPAAEADASKANIAPEAKNVNLNYDYDTVRYNRAARAEVSAEAETESRKTGDDYKDMPFIFDESEEKAPSHSAKPTRSDSELNVRWKAGLSENRDANGVRLSYPSEAVRYAQQTYGNQLDSVQASAKELASRQTIYDTENFEALYGKDFTEAARDRVRQFKGLADDVAHGIRNVGELHEAYEALKDDRFMADFYNEATAKAISRAWDSLKEADAESTPYSVNRFRWDASKAMAMTAKSFERGAQAQADKAEFSRAASENLKPIKTKVVNGREQLTADRLRDWFMRIQQSAPNVFRSIDGWKNEGGIGYQLADEAEKAFVRQTEEYAKGEDCFVGVDEAKDFDKFVKGETGVHFIIGKKAYKISELEAITLLKDIETINSSGGEARADKLSGLYVGDRAIRFDDGFKIYSLVDAIESQLTPAGRTYMKAFTDMLDYYAKPLRETHSEVYGGDKGMYAKGKYMPLRYASADGKARAQNIADDANLGYDSLRIMQSRGNANSGYLLIEPATQVADWYMRNASNYIAYSGFSERLAALNRSTAYSPSAADVMSQYFGENGSQWMDKYVDGLGRASKSSEQSAGSKFLKQLRMNLYQGALGLSPTVPLKQLASYWSAADVVGMGNLLLSYRFKILTPAKGHSMQNPVMRSRRRGSIDPTYADIMKNNETAIGRLRSKNKVVNWLAEGISRMDYKVLDNIYTACERAVRQENPKIDVKSDEYRKLVDDKFNLVALRTQSIFAPTVSAEMQRSDNELLKSLSMFRTQQTQDFSRTVKAINEYRNAPNEEAKAAAASTLRASVVGSVASSVSLGLMTAAARLLMHKRRDYEDDDGNIDPKLILRNVGFDSAKSLAGMVWFGDEISSAILSAITRGDEKYYGFSLGGLDSVNDALESLTTFSENPSVYNGKRVVGAVSTAFGIPANNVYAMLNSVVMWSLDFTHNNDGSYDDVLKWLHNEAGGNISDFNVDEEKVELTASERHEYKRIFDESEERFSADYAGLPGFSSLNERQLKSVFKAMRSYSDYKAKQAILDERGDDRELYRQSWYDLPERKMVQYLTAREQAKALYDDDGNITDYSAMDKWLRESYGTLDAQQKELLGKSGMSRIDDMYQALYQGISSKEYDAAYKLYKKYDEASGSGTVRAEDLKTEIGALGLKKEQAAWLSNNLKLWQHMPIDTDSYDKLVDAGIPDGKANKLRDDMRALPVLAGKSGVTNNQKYAAIMDASYLDDKQKWAAFYTIATDAARKEADKYRAIGYSYDQWLSTSKKYGIIK